MARAEAALPPLDLLGEPANYRDVIRHFHAFYAQWEPVIWRSEEVASLFDPPVSARLKLPLLEADLAALCVRASWRRHLAIPGLSPNAALGALYVLEGATLGGRVILKHITSRLRVDLKTGTTFFTGYGERAATMWREFGDTLERHVALVGGTDEILNGAVACFSAFERWFLAFRTLRARSAGDEIAHACT